MRRRVVLFSALLVIAILAAVYAGHSLRISETFDVLQIPVESFSHEMLYQGSLILFNEPIVDAREACRTFLRYHYAFEKKGDLQPGIAVVNRSKYMAVSFARPTAVAVVHPYYPDERLELEVQRDGLVLVPRLFSIETEAAAECIRFDDVFTWIWS